MRRAGQGAGPPRFEGGFVKRTLLALILSALLLAMPANAGDLLGFTEQVSPQEETNATEPYIAIDHSDGTVWVAWQASGTHVARSDDGGRSFVQTPIADLFGPISATSTSPWAAR